MAIHELKCQIPFYKDIVEGTKRFEVRLGDRNVKVGDTLIFKEFTTEHGFTGREASKKVTYVLSTKAMLFWSNEDVEKFGLSIFSLADIDPLDQAD